MPGRSDAATALRWSHATVLSVIGHARWLIILAGFAAQVSAQSGMTQHSYYFNTGWDGWTTPAVSGTLAFKRCTGLSCSQVLYTGPPYPPVAADGYYLLADSWGTASGSRFTLSYPGSACASTRVAAIGFWYHM
jgi:hypothetical protein